MSTRPTMLIAATAASPKPPAVRLRIEAATAASAFLRRLGMPFRRIVGESLRKRSSVDGMILRSPAFLR